MGTVYCGPFAEAIGDHEGYPARILPDGTETGTWTYQTREFIGYRAACGCGWRGQHHYAATEQGEQLAGQEWDHDHLQPLVDAAARQHAVPAHTLLDLAHELRQSVTTTVSDRGEQVITDYSRGVLDTAERLEHLLDHLTDTDPTEKR